LRKAKESKTIPERYYRELMREDQGLLIIYLFDSNYAFNQKGKNAEKDPYLKNEFKKYITDNGIDLNIPLVGFALGFPPIENDPGGEYMQGDYNIDEDEGVETVDDDFTEDSNEL